MITIRLDEKDVVFTIGDTLTLTGGLADGKWKLMTYNKRSQTSIFKDGRKRLIINRKGFKIREYKLSLRVNKKMWR